MMRSQLADSVPPQSQLLCQPQFKTIFGHGLITSWTSVFVFHLYSQFPQLTIFFIPFSAIELVEQFSPFKHDDSCSIHILNQIEWTLYSLFHDSYALLIVLLKQVQEDGSMHHNPSKRDRYP